jgi:hypothetical protein
MNKGQIKQLLVFTAAGFIILSLLTSIPSCQNSPVPIVKDAPVMKVKEPVAKPDSFLIWFAESLRYKHLSDSCEIQSLMAEVHYNQTGKELYVRRFNMLQDLKVKYAKLGGIAYSKWKNRK